MKKLIFLAAAFVTMASAVSAQAPVFGVRGGLNLASLTNNGGDAKMKPSIYVGGFAEWRLGSIVAISPELVYSRQGFSAKEGDFKMNLRMNYFNIPVLAKLYLTDALSLDLGPQIGFMLNSKVWAKDGNTSVTLDLPNDYIDIDLNSLDVSFAMGLTYNLNNNFFVQGRYNLGLTDVAKDDDGHSKNSVFQLGVGCRF